VRSFDVALVPYVRSEYTLSVNPTKLYEYLAMGCPVVSSDLAAVRELGLPSEAVRITSTNREFVDAVGVALASDSHEARNARARLVLDKDWSVIVGRMAQLIAERIEAKVKSALP
jgi:glycosyltransferase involved in cell wall biosynthesis